MVRNPVRLAAAAVLIIMSPIGAAQLRAQSAVGTGPLTGMLSDTEPISAVLRAGPILIAPGVTVRELGWDSNVFDEPDDAPPKEDWVAAAIPDVSFYSRLRFLRISAYASSELTYYHEYESERSVGYSARGRFDFLLSRVRPFVGVGELKTRERPNGEIDARADRREDELSGGLAFDISPNALVYGSSMFSNTTYQNAIEDGVDLSQALNKDRAEYQAGFKTDLTPLLSVQLYGSYTDDEFKFQPLRNTTSSAANATFRFAADAVVNGTITVGYKDQQPVDPKAADFRGFTANAAIVYPLLELGRFFFTANRNTEYSFDASQAYYVENSFGLSYTHLLFGELDAQVRGAKSFFDYSAQVDSPSHTDTLDTVGGSVGYNLRNRSRIAVNYEFARRRSPETASRNYDRRRIYLSWAFVI